MKICILLIMLTSISIPAIADPLVPGVCNTNRFSYGPNNERRAAFNVRLADDYMRTLEQATNNMTLKNNGDQNTVPFFASQFSKTFEHDLVTGLLTAQGQASYEQLLVAMSNGKQADFNRALLFV
jgi:hypothetical protein